MLLISCCPVALALEQVVEIKPTWQKTRTAWPDTSNQVRSMISTEGGLYVGTSGTIARSAQVWRLVDGGWTKQAEFKSLKAAVLQADADGNLYVGTGTPHSAETRGRGAAEVWRIDAKGSRTRLRAFPQQDIAYSMAWFQGKLHVGTMTEDIRGRAELWRFDDPGWTQMAGQGVPGWPEDNSYAGVYEMWTDGSALIAGMFSRTMADGDVLKLVGNRWVDLQAPESHYALCFVSYRGRLVVSLSNLGAKYHNPVFALQKDGTWQPLGKAPAEWEGAYIPNHMIVYRDVLYLGVGGKRGTLSVWKYDGGSWTKLAGDGLNGSWVDPLVSRGAEWVYRLSFHKGKLYAGLASDRSPFQAQVWAMSP